MRKVLTFLHWANSSWQIVMTIASFFFSSTSVTFEKLARVSSKGPSQSRIKLTLFTIEEKLSPFWSKNLTIPRIWLTDVGVWDVPTNKILNWDSQNCTSAASSGWTWLINELETQKKRTYIRPSVGPELLGCFGGLSKQFTLYARSESFFGARRDCCCFGSCFVCFLLRRQTCNL